MTSVSPSEDAEVPRAARVAAALPRSLRSFAKTTGDRRRGEKERRREIERERERGGGGRGREGAAIDTVAYLVRDKRS